MLFEIYRRMGTVEVQDTIAVTKWVMRKWSKIASFPAANVALKMRTSLVVEFCKSSTSGSMRIGLAYGAGAMAVSTLAWCLRKILPPFSNAVYLSRLWPLGSITVIDKKKKLVVYFLITLILISRIPNDMIFNSNTVLLSIAVRFVTDSIYTERYMGLPTVEDNLMGYTGTDIMRQAEGIRGKKYMLIHGTADDNVHYQQAMALVKTLEHNDILFEQVTYTDEAHDLKNVSPHFYHTMDKFWSECFGWEYWLNLDSEKRIVFAINRSRCMLMFMTQETQSAWIENRRLTLNLFEFDFELFWFDVKEISASTNINGIKVLIIRLRTSYFEKRCLDIILKTSTVTMENIINTFYQ